MEADPRAVVSGALIAGLLAGYGIALPVGAIASYLVALTARTSLRIGCAAALGVASADGLYALVAVFGGSAVAVALEPMAAPLKFGSAVVLLCLAAWTAKATVRGHRHVGGGVATPTSPGLWRAYAGLLGLTLLNPATIVYFTALVVGNSHTLVGSASARAVFVLAAFAASASWQLTLACGGALLGTLLTGPRGRLLTRLGSSLLTAALAVAMLA